jgi:hypothetical protein
VVSQLARAEIPIHGMERLAGIGLGL